jgi:hypothetical protein
MWQTVCEHWKFPNYCYDTQKAFRFTSVIPKNLTYVENNCINFKINQSIMTDGMLFITYSKIITDKTVIPKCEYVPEQRIKCSAYCPDKRIENLSTDFDLICGKNGTTLSTCDHKDPNEFVKAFEKESGDLNCMVSNLLYNFTKNRFLLYAFRPNVSSTIRSNGRTSATVGRRTCPNSVNRMRKLMRLTYRSSAISTQ